MYQQECQAPRKALRELLRWKSRAVQGCGWTSSSGWKASCLNLCSELPWPMQVSLGMTQCRQAVTTPVSQAFWFRGSETTFSPTSLHEAHKVGDITIPANLDTTSLTHRRQKAFPGNNSCTHKSWMPSEALSLIHFLPSSSSAYLTKMTGCAGINVQHRF